MEPGVEDDQGGAPLSGGDRGERLRQVNGQLLGQVAHAAAPCAAASQSVTARRADEPATESGGAANCARTASWVAWRITAA